jgi:hypothetical protein
MINWFLESLTKPEAINTTNREAVSVENDLSKYCSMTVVSLQLVSENDIIYP